ASPLRGRTCPSKPAGIASLSPVGTSARAPGASVMTSPSASAARRSMPAAPAVRYAGRSSAPCVAASVRSTRTTTTAPSARVARSSRSTLEPSGPGGRRRRALLLERRAPRQLDLALAIDAEHLDHDLVAFLDDVLGLAHAAL